MPREVQRVTSSFINISGKKLTKGRGGESGVITIHDFIDMTDDNESFAEGSL